MYQHIPGKGPKVKGKVSISFTSSFRLVNVDIFKIILQPPTNTMVNFLSFAKFQTHTSHTQDVGNQNQGYQEILPDLYFTRNSTC